MGLELTLCPVWVWSSLALLQKSLSDAKASGLMQKGEADATPPLLN